MLPNTKKMNVLGFSGTERGHYYEEAYGIRIVGHDSAIALVQDGKVTFAQEEERLNRKKHTSELPIKSLRAALEFASLDLRDIDLIAYPWNATPKKMLHMISHHPFRIPIRNWPELAIVGSKVLSDLMIPRNAFSQFEKTLGQKLPPGVGISHHLGHSASAFFTSSFESAASLTIDGQGEDESASFGVWQGTKYIPIGTVRSPDSIGLLYGMVTDFLGMRAGWDEYKVMAMAAYGDGSRFKQDFDSLVQLRADGQYRTDRTAMVFSLGYCDKMLARIFRMSKKQKEDDFAQIHYDLAASLQRKTEDVIFHLLHYLRQNTTLDNLCLGGGVFQNSVANGKIRKSRLFENVYIPPVPGDHGGALGAALVAYYEASGKPRVNAEFTPFSGPQYTESEMLKVLNGANLIVNRPVDLCDATADLIAGNRIIGWFQGRSEYGPRALGHRSILANPTNPDMRDRINELIKHRELFRPFAAIVPEEQASLFFAMEGSSPYMQFVLPITTLAEKSLPAVIHPSGSRVQTVTVNSDPLIYEILVKFGEKTGVPVLLNTSFNDVDEPIVCSPEDAVRTFIRTQLDELVMGPFLVHKPS